MKYTHKIEWVVDHSLTYVLYFIRKSNLKYTHLGKSYPIHTQCLLFANDLIEGYDTIVKHEKDVDNQKLSYEIVSENVIKNACKNKWIVYELIKKVKEFEL